MYWSTLHMSLKSSNIVGRSLRLRGSTKTCSDRLRRMLRVERVTALKTNLAKSWDVLE